MGLATVEMEVCFPSKGGLAIQGGSPGAFVRVSCREAHTCNRFCRFQHQVGNLYVCVTSGASHICDQTCQQRVLLDGYTSQCRLSGRRFEQVPERDVLSKRPLLTDETCDPCAKRRHSDLNGGEQMDLEENRPRKWNKEGGDVVRQNENRP